MGRYSLRVPSFSSALSTVLVGMALAVLTMPSTAFAVSPEKKFRGQIIISTKRFPSKFKSDKAMNKWMKKNNTHTIRAAEGEDWEFEYMAFLKKPVQTIQASVTFYDISVPGTETMVDTYTFYPQDKGDKIIASNQVLPASKYSKDRKYLMVFARGYGQAALAKTQVVLRTK